jgi:L-ascorbate metabolism protein UlaG (beta-lactamase superfamily)
MSDSYCLIRNATTTFKYGGKKYLIDPMLAQKGAYPGFEHSANSHLRNPLVDLPMSVEDVLKGVDAVILTHTHPDHWDEAAVQAIPKSLLIFVQNAADAELLKSQGFTNVQIMSDDDTDLGNGITMHKAPCQHGSDKLYAVPQMAEMLGQVAGLVFRRPGGKSVYFVGDTIWFSGVAETMTKYKPDFVVLNIGNATLDDFGPIIMGEDDVSRTLAVVPDAVVIAQHMEAINHCVLTRQQLREFVEKKGVASSVFIPADGEFVSLSA